MKVNKIFMALAAMAMVGCSSEDVMDFTGNQAAEDSRLIQLNPDFALAGVGADDNTTRTHFEVAPSGAVTNKFLPIYGATAAAGMTLNEAVQLEKEAVGLCWLGNGAVGTDVYTNYQFYHFGWLNNGAKEAEFECGTLKTGALYTELELDADGTPYAEADAANFKYTAASGKTGTPKDILNINSGIYKTDNKAIFGGQYIVYYPFNEEFKEVGTIPAKAITVFDNVSTNVADPEFGNATFRYSKPVTIEGGSQAAGFGLTNLSTLVQLKITTTESSAKTIDQIVLYSKSGQLLKQANLAADKIVAGKKGTELYASTEGTKTIVANFETPASLSSTSPVNAFITLLPTTVEDLVVLIHSNSLKKWAKVEIAKDKAVFEAGKAVILGGTNAGIRVNSGSFETSYIAVDEKSLTTALTEARAAGGKKTIEVIGDITLKGTGGEYDINQTNDADITIKGDDIIVPEDVTLKTKAQMQSKIRVLGKTCCSSAITGGRLEIYEGGLLSDVTMEKADKKATGEYADINPKVTYEGAATVDKDKTFDAEAGTIIVNAPVQHKASINIAEGVTVTVNGAGGLNFMGGTVDNSGTIEVMKNGKFDMTDKDGNAAAQDGKRMTNNATGKFIHNIDAAVGTSVQSMIQNGEYRCKVDQQIKLDDAYQQWIACSVIEMVNADEQKYDLGSAEPNIAYKHNGKYIDIEVNAIGKTIFVNPDLGSGNGDSKAIQIGNLTSKNGALEIDFVKGEGKRTLTVNGDMAVSAKTAIVTSKKVSITENLTITKEYLRFAGNRVNEEGLAVKKDITVSGATFDASAVDALNITCANFKLSDGATATFGNRTDGVSVNMAVSGTIENPAGCTFEEKAANQIPGSVLARITCKKLIVGGAFPGGKPLTIE